MRLSPWVLVSALLLAACQTLAGSGGAEPSPTLPQARPSPTAARLTPTATARASAPSAAVSFRQAAELLQVYKPVDTDPAPLHQALSEASIELLEAGADPDRALAVQPVLMELDKDLRALPLPADTVPVEASIHLRDSEGGSEDLLLIGLQNLMGLGLIGIHRLGGSYQQVAVDPAGLLSGAPDPSFRSFWVSTLTSSDVTGDGIGEAILTYEIPGGSGGTTELHVMRWDGASGSLVAIMRAVLISWAGESSYELIPGEHGQDIQLTYPWFGVFDHKLVEHPSASQVWAYDPQQDKFVERSETIEPARTVRQQLNAGEELFRRGELEKAVEAFGQAWSDQALAEEEWEGQTRAARAFARFRQGELLALLGRSAEARAALADARKAGGDIARLAAAFLNNYAGEDAAIRAWAALPSAIDLDQAIYNGSNVDLPSRALDIFDKGEVPAAYLAAHPDAGAGLFAAVKGLGLSFSDSAAIDLDGDGQSEYLMTTHEGGASPNQSDVLWLIYRGQTRWLARPIANGEKLALGGSVPLPGGKGTAFGLEFGPNVQPPAQILTWDRTRIIQLDPQSLEPKGRLSPWPVVGGFDQLVRF